MHTQEKTAEELKSDFEAIRLTLPTEHLQKLGTSMLSRGGLPGFQLVLHPELEPLDAILQRLLIAEQREAPQKKRA